MIRFLKCRVPQFQRADVELCISLDHDLGACGNCQDKHEDAGGTGLISECEHIGTGYDVCLFLEELVHDSVPGILPLMHITVHSDNAGARPKMLQAIANIERFLSPS